MTVTLTAEKKEKYKELCLLAYNSHSITIRELCRLIGKLVSAFEGVQFGKLFYRKLECAKISGLQQHDGDFDVDIPVTPSMKEDILWWIENLPSAFNYISRPMPSQVLYTDATKTCWGAVLNDEETGGFFTCAEMSAIGDNINGYEILAIKLAILAFRSFLAPTHVLVKTDNTTAVAYINDMGGTKSKTCNRLARQVWNLCINLNLWLTAEHIEGTKNCEADFQSRTQNDRTEWSLQQSIFDQLCRIFGTPDVDAFASRLNNKLAKFVSWQCDPGSFHVNAFTLPWHDLYCYLFPPFSLLPRVAQKLHQEQPAQALIIVPFWPTQIWFPAIMRLLVDTPVILPRSQNTLLLPHRPEFKHPLHNKMRLLACKLSGNPSSQEEYQRKLQTSSWPPGATGQSPNMNVILKSGDSFVVQGKLVTALPLWKMS